jgi:hypothetical protein
MNNKPYLVIAYHLILFLESMILVTAIAGYTTPLFHQSLHLNTLYLPIGGICNYLTFRLLHPLIINKFLLITLHFISVLFLLNIFTHFAQGEWITQHLFSTSNDKQWFSFLAHLLVADCYLCAVLLTRKIMQ